MSRCQPDSSPSNHSRTDSAIVGPTPSAAASCSTDADSIAAIDPNSVASARAAVGPTCRIDSPTSTRHSGTCLAWSRLASSRSPLADSTRPSTATSASVFLARAREQVGLQQLVAVEVEHVALVGDHLRRPQRVRRLRAEALDVERTAPRDVEDPVEHLRPAELVVGAAEVLVALLLLHELRCRTRGSDVGITHFFSPFGRSPSTGPTISGITSPALRSTTVSPGRTSLRVTSWALCSVARSTVEPATRVGSITPNGVTRPVRPVLTSIEISLALTSSGGYLNAIAHRGARDVDPSRRWSATASTFTTTPSISCSTVVAVLAVVVDELADLLQRPEHPHPVAGGQPPRLQRVVGRGLRRSARSPRARRCRGRPCPRSRVAVTRGSFCRSEPAAALRGLANTGLPASVIDTLSRSNASVGQEHLAAHLDQCRHRELLARRQPVRHRVDRLDVGGDVLTGASVAARQRPHQPAAPRTSRLIASPSTLSSHSRSGSLIAVALEPGVPGLRAPRR